MRTSASPFLAALALAAWLPAADRAIGQTELQLVTFTTPWKYYLTNAYGPDGAWTATNYDDSSWLTGLPLFGGDANPAAPYLIPFSTAIATPPGGGPATLYFRTHFEFPSNTAGVTLTASILLDDGAVCYLNGAEVQRIRMPAGAVTYGTWAYNQPSEGVFEVFNMPTTNLRRGDNVLAAELHQTSAVSADSAFGMSLTALIPTAIRITRQPQSQVVSAGQPVTFTVAVTGSSPSYRWFRQPSPVVLTTNQSVTISQATPAAAGDYYVVITNIFGAVTSEVAVLTVVTDVFPPGLLSAIAQDSGSSNTIVVTFTEPVDRTLGATNTTNYLIGLPGTANRVLVTEATYGGSTVTLTVDPANWIWGRDCLLEVTHVADLKTNYMSALSNQIAVAFPQLLLGWNGTSLCWDALGASLQIPPVNLPADWMLPETDDTSPLWFPVAGIAYADRDPVVTLCASRGEALDFASRVPRYFRSHLAPAAGLGQLRLRLRHAIDDGAVFYLNGQEIHRFNLPPGPVSTGTVALVNGAPVCQETNLLVQALPTGGNLLAVEVHNSSDAQDLDIYYGVELSAIWLPDPIVIPTPRLTIVPAEGGTVRLDWPADTGLDWTLETTTDLTSGSWVPVATSPPFQTDVAPGATQFYRLRGPGPL